MNFEWAIKQLKEGKKVRRPSWKENSCWVLGIDQKICWKDETTAHIHINQIEATDWEIYKKDTKYFKEVMSRLNRIDKELENIRLRTLINKVITFYVKKGKSAKDVNYKIEENGDITFY